MMPDNNPFLEGYIATLPGKQIACPYQEGSTEYERWYRGSRGTVVAMEAVAAPSEPVAVPVLEGRRPFVEGYKAAIFGGREACAYEEGTAEYERWWKGFRGWTGSKGKAAKKSITTPFLEGRRPYVEGYKAAILGNAFAHDDVTAEYERWSKGAPWWAAAKSAAEQPAYR
jgi:hypothetical protein